jgi:hypothetical protein
MLGTHPTFPRSKIILSFDKPYNKEFFCNAFKLFYHLLFIYTPLNLVKPPSITISAPVTNVEASLNK